MSKGANAARHDDEAGKSPAEIESDIARTRAELGLTIDALEQKLAPRHLLEKGFDMIRDSMGRNQGGSGRNPGANSGQNSGMDLGIGSALRSNPVPLALIGLGVAWLLATNTGIGETIAGDQRVRAARRRIGDMASNLGERAGSVASTVGERAGAIASSVGEQAGAIASSVGERATALASDIAGRVGLGGEQEARSPEAGQGRQQGGQGQGQGQRQGQGSQASGGSRSDSSGWVHQVAGTTQDVARTVRDSGSAVVTRAGDAGRAAWDSASGAAEQLTDTFERHPLLIGALGVVSGAVIAALLPSTRIENEWVGETRDELWHEAEEFGRGAVREARQVAERAVGAVADAAVSVAKEEAQKLNLVPEEGGDGDTGAKRG